MTDRSKTVMMVFGLCHQLRNWIDYARAFGFMTQKFKQDSGVIRKHIDSFIANYGAEHDEVFEHSVQVSELFERIAKMDEQDIKRIVNLINKIELQKSNGKDLSTEINRIYRDTASVSAIK
jgi:hypothetical protein